MARLGCGRQRTLSGAFQAGGPSRVYSIFGGSCLTTRLLNLACDLGPAFGKPTPPWLPIPQQAHRISQQYRRLGEGLGVAG
jgi:hypothetical protein